MLEQITNLLEKKEARESFVEYANSAMEEGKELSNYGSIPVLSFLTSAGKYALSVRDRTFLKRLGQVFEELGSLNEKAVKDFAVSLEEEGSKEAFTDHLMTIVEQTESEYKAKIISIMFKRMIEGKMDRDKFEFLCFATSRTQLINLYQLRNAASNPNIFEGSLGSCLSSLRLVDTTIEVALSTDRFGRPRKEKDGGVPIVKNSYKINHYGRLLVDVINELSPIERGASLEPFFRS